MKGSPTCFSQTWNFIHYSILKTVISFLFPELGGYKATIDTHSPKGFYSGKSSVKSV